MNASTSSERKLLRPFARIGLIWQMIALAFIVHLVLLLVLSPGLFAAGEDSPERIFERGEVELARGNYSEAMQLFQKVMDLQPKVPPVFEKAAEQHKAAERLARRGPAIPTTRPGGEAPGTDTATAAPSATRSSAPATKPATAPQTRPANTPFIPPELRAK